MQHLQRIRLVNETFERRPSFDPSADERHFVIAVSDYVAMVMFDRLLPEVAKEAPPRLQADPHGRDHARPAEDERGD